MTAERSNEEWLQALDSGGASRAAALEDLRLILLRGLNRGLLNRVDTSAPEFETMAEDFVQEALLKILDNRETFGGRSKFTTWAQKIAVHTALTELRRKRWQDSSLEQITEREDGIYTPAFTADPAPSPHSAAERNDMLRRVNRILEEELTEKQHTVIRLCVIEGEPAAVVARKMDSNPNAIYKLLHDARLRVKQQLEEEGLTAEEVIAVFE